MASGPVVPVMLPKIQNVSEYIELTGNAASVNTVKLIARVEGYLDKIHFKDGQIVKKGDLLFTIQQEQYQGAARPSRSAGQGAGSCALLRKYRSETLHGP